MDAEAELALGVAVAPAEVHPAFHRGAAAALGVVGRVGEETGARRAGLEGRQRSALEADPEAAPHFERRARLGNPQPQVAGVGETGEAAAREAHGVERRDERRLLPQENAEVRPVDAHGGGADAQQRVDTAADAAAVEVQLEVAAERPAQRARVRHGDAEPGLSRGATDVAAGCAAGVGEQWHVAVVDGGAVGVRVDEDQAGQLHAIAQARADLGLVLLLEPRAQQLDGLFGARHAGREGFGRQRCLRGRGRRVLGAERAGQAHREGHQEA